MLKSTETLLEAGFAGKILCQRDFQRVFERSASRCYALVNKALKRGELLQLKRDALFLHPKFLSQTPSLYHIACQMEPHSYISLESALSYHGWIPEQVTVVNSIINHSRTKSFNTPLGTFYYYSLPTNPYEFLTGVLRDSINDQPFFIATPLRALLDYVYEKKLDWNGLDYLTDSLRIELHYLKQIEQYDFFALKRVYRAKRVLNFIDELAMAMDSS